MSLSLSLFLCLCLCVSVSVSVSVSFLFLFLFLFLCLFLCRCVRALHWTALRCDEVRCLLAVMRRREKLRMDPGGGCISRSTRARRCFFLQSTNAALLCSALWPYPLILILIPLTRRFKARLGMKTLGTLTLPR
jgi:hypothetical protein